jgi:Tol biopolymer transport system component/DNA-binding winged helix-turn-helix (wHTH) protein
MPVLSRHSAPFQLGAWWVDPSTGQITRGSDVRRARPLVADLLLYLVARAGEVVTKNELVAGPWGGAAIADSAITSTIAELRELLDDQPKAPQYIETLPKRGYRLIATVGVPEPAASAAPDAEPEVSPADPPTTVTPVAATVARPRWSRHSWALAFGLGVAFAIAVAVSIASRGGPAGTTAKPGAMRLTVDLPQGMHLAPESVLRLALTRDGSRIAFVARTDASLALYTRTLDQFEAHRVTGADDARAPFFSPDGSRLGFFAHNELRTVPVAGGTSTLLCSARASLGASWAPDEVIVFSGEHGHGLFEVSARGGEPRPLTVPNRDRAELSHRWPQVLPDGDHVLYTTIKQGRTDLMVVSRRTREQTLVVENAYGGVVVPPDRLLFERDRRAMAASIDPDRFVLTGEPRVVLEDYTPAGPGFGSPGFAAASNGAIVYVPIDPHEHERELVWVDRTGEAAPVGTPARYYMHPRVSADGRQILSWLRTGDPDLWLIDVASRALTRITTGVHARRAAWSPDGLRVIFDAEGPDNPVTLYEADIRGGGARRLRADQNSQYAGAWRPDGRAIAFLDLRITTGFDIVTMSAEPDAPAVPVMRTPANESAPAFSPDGRWLAFVSDATGREEVYLLPYPTGGVPVQISKGGGREPLWSRRGDELFLRHGLQMLAVRVNGADRPRLSEPVVLFSGDFDQRPAWIPSYDVAPDGRFLMVRGTAPPTADTRIAVLLRWDAQ